MDGTEVSIVGHKPRMGSARESRTRAGTGSGHRCIDAPAAGGHELPLVAEARLGPGGSWRGSSAKVVTREGDDH
jgi:hypothetical protein